MGYPVTGGFTISGLQAGCNYEIYLLSARANTGISAEGTTWTIAGANSSILNNVKVSTTSLGESPSTSPTFDPWSSGMTSKTVNFDGSTDGKNATIVGFKFNAGTAEAIKLSSQINKNFTVNGILVRAIPEPSMFGLLAGMGALTLVASRRRRK